MAGPLDLKAGDVFAVDYRIMRKLGEGGMGTVYEVEQRSTERRRALKILLPEVLDKPGVRKRFETEAKVGAQIESDHVVEVISAGVEPAPWLVMELLEGEELEAFAARIGPVSPGAVREILDQLCHALGDAHAKGIVHRDLKPENIFLAKPRHKGVSVTVKILDFGIAKIMAEVKTASSKTRGLLGSPLWMAPEQTDPDNAQITPAADVWSLGLIVFRLLAGQCFWKTASKEGATLFMLFNESFVIPIPAASARAAEFGVPERIPPGFDAWFARCMVRDWRGRIPDAAQAYAELEAILGGPANATPMPLTPAPAPSVVPAPLPMPAPPEERVVAVGLPHAAPLTPPVAKTEPVPDPPEVLGMPPRPKVALAVAAPAPPVRRGALLLGVGAVALLAGLMVVLRPWKSPIVSSGGGARDAGADADADADVKETVSTSATVLPPPPEPCPEGMVLIPAGTFTMGSTDGDADEKPPHKVSLSAFCMDKTEVTVAAYRQCTKEARNGVTCAVAPLTVQWSGYSAADIKLLSQLCNGDKADKDAHPINCVDWTHGDAYCRWMGGYLPTEAQWEYAARGTDGRKYPWGNDPVPGPKLLNACGTECRAMGARLGKNGWGVMYDADDGAEATAPVGKYPAGASPFGVLDMAGNVWEWVVDWYAPYPAEGKTIPEDPKGPDKSPESRRVIRGGGWFSTDASWVRAAIRYGSDVTDRDNVVGFRCARGPK